MLRASSCDGFAGTGRWTGRDPLRWFDRPSGQPLVLRKRPRIGSWNKNSHPDQIRLREYLDDTEQLVAPSRVTGPWTLRPDVVIPKGRDLLVTADVDNYAHPLAARLSDPNLVSVWCSKSHAPESHVAIEAAMEVGAPVGTHHIPSTVSGQSVACKRVVRAAVFGAAEIESGPVALQVAFAVGPRRNWLNLWKPTIDALDPLLGRTTEGRDWHPQDGHITTLGLHLTVDTSLGNDIVIEISAVPAST